VWWYLDGWHRFANPTSRVLWYPTQAKIRLEWGTHLLLPVHRKLEESTIRQHSHPLPVPAANSFHTHFLYRQQRLGTPFKPYLA
jgi:hypothetical protein